MIYAVALLARHGPVQAINLPDQLNDVDPDRLTLYLALDAVRLLTAVLLTIAVGTSWDGRRAVRPLLAMTLIALLLAQSLNYRLWVLNDIGNPFPSALRTSLLIGLVALHSEVLLLALIAIAPGKGSVDIDGAFNGKQPDRFRTVAVLALLAGSAALASWWLSMLSWEAYWTWPRRLRDLFQWLSLQATTLSVVSAIVAVVTGLFRRQLSRRFLFIFAASWAAIGVIDMAGSVNYMISRRGKGDSALWLLAQALQDVEILFIHLAQAVLVWLVVRATARPVMVGFEMTPAAVPESKEPCIP